MVNYLIYLLAFLAVVLPFVWYTLSDRNSRPERKKTQDGEPLPMLFRLCAAPARFLNAAGIGPFFCRLFPAKARTLRKKLLYAGLDLIPEQVYCVRLFLLVFLSALAGGVAGAVASEDQSMSSAVAALIGALKSKKKSLLEIVFAAVTIAVGVIVALGNIVDIVLLIGGILLIVDGVLGLISCVKGKN